jgi:hypothetical protein
MKKIKKNKKFQDENLTKASGKNISVKTSNGGNLKFEEQLNILVRKTFQKLDEERH